MKYIILLACFFGLGYVSNNDQVELIDQMQSTCKQSYQVWSGPLEDRCGVLIDKIQENDKLEVITDNLGNFWVESK